MNDQNQQKVLILEFVWSGKYLLHRNYDLLIKHGWESIHDFHGNGMEAMLRLTGR
jgi:hypothetical protein